MLILKVKGIEMFDERTEEFLTTRDTTLQLEHSLISLSKWESKWHKPFLGTDQRTNEEVLDYIRCMTITQNIDPNVYRCLTKKHFEMVDKYMEDKMTATWFSDDKNPKSRQKVVTAELIYYWMITLQIPFECEKWHLNRLLTLIRVCNLENAPKKKMSQKDVFKQNARLNAERKKLMNTTG